MVGHGDRELHYSRSCRTWSLLTRDNEQFIRSLAEEVEGHFLVNDFFREPISKLRSGKAADVCRIPAELLKAGDEPMAWRSHAIQSAIWQSVYQARFLAHILLRRIRDHLLRHQRPEQFRFTSGKSTIDYILVLQVIVERRCKFGRGLLAAYIDLKKAFNTVSWTKTKVQDFGDLLGEPVQLVCVCNENIEVTESFTYLSSVVQSSGLSDQEVSRRSGLAAGVMNSLDKCI
ncbi:uncharacterized protein [Penaeus vannamei]|uniref:uncharacterized protein n=1 Tax=Penaeus vannamei TaxID=6689 RepID=UPI00387F99F6